MGVLGAVLGLGAPQAARCPPGTGGGGSGVPAARGLHTWTQPLADVALDLPCCLGCSTQVGMGFLFWLFLVHFFFTSFPLQSPPPP